MELLGHSSVTITQRYTHSNQKQKKAAVELLAEKKPQSPKKRGNLLHICDIGDQEEKEGGTNYLFSIN